MRGNKLFVSVVLIMICAAFTGTFMLKYRNNLCEIEKRIEMRNPHQLSFLTFDEEATKTIVNSYGLQYEQHPYKVVLNDGITARIITGSREMDIPYYIEGTEPASETEAAVDQNYYETHELKIGDMVSLPAVDTSGEFNASKEYRISGVIVLPDQIQPVVDNQGSMYDSEKQGIFWLTQEAYDSYSVEESSVFTAKLPGGREISNEMKQKLKGETGITNLVFAEDDSQMNALEGKITLFTATLICCTGILGLTVLVTLAMAISREVAKEQASMGVLKAMGYQTLGISLRYGRFGLYLLPGALAGYIAGSCFAPGFARQLNGELLIPEVSMKLFGGEAILFVLVPTVVFVIAAILLAALYLRREPLQLIYDNVEDKVNALVRRRNRSKEERTFLQSVSRTAAANHLVLIFFVAFAGFAVAAQFQMAYSLQRMCQNIVTSVFDGADYVSDVHFLMENEDLESNENQTPYEEITCSIGIADTIGTSSLQILPEDYRCIELISYQQKKVIDVNEEDGVIINYWMSNKYGVKKGDSITITVGEEDYVIPIAEVEQAYTGNVIYSSIQTAKKYGMLKDGEALSYNGMYTKEYTTFQKGTHAYITRLEEKKAAIMSKASVYQGLSFIFIILGVVLSVITMTLAMRSVISSNKKYLAMMKTFGYNGRESAKAVLSRYRVIVMIGFVIGTIYGYILMKLMFGMVSKSSTAYYPMTTDGTGIVISFAALILIYESIYQLYRRQISQVSLKEVME